MFLNTIYSEDGRISVDPSIFADLYLIGLKNINADNYAEIISRYKLELSKSKVSEIDKLKDFQSFLKRFFNELTDKIQDEIQLQIKKEELNRDLFLDSITDRDYLSANQLEEAGFISKPTIRKHKENFVIDGNGVQLKTFLSWFRFYDQKEYERFKVEYKTLKK